jgi:RNA-dependent RNA polymerase
LTFFDAQTRDLVETIRGELLRTDEISSSEDGDQNVEDDDDESDEKIAVSKRGEVCRRAWAALSTAWTVAEKHPDKFGVSSFGLIALGVLLEVIDEASDDIGLRLQRLHLSE